MNFRAWIAELIGTFAFVFVGVGSIVANALPGGSMGIVGIAIAHGVAIAVVATATGPVSGGHINPAVSIGAWLVNKLSLGNMIGYVVAQVVGAVVAIRVLVFVEPPNAMVEATFGIPALNPSTTFWQGFTIEAALTFMLMFVVYGTAMHKKAVAMGGWFVGMLVLMGILMAGPLTGGSFNPARYLGPAIATADYKDIVLYLAAPVLGAALAALVYHWWLGDEPEQPA